ncbi:MAG: DUF167 family protein [Alphaproteobacteria bacterium]
MASPFQAMADGVRIAVRLTPKASRNQVQGAVADADGKVALKIAVTAVPADGKANAALLALLAKEWRVPKSALSIVAGASDRRKILFLAGDGAALVRQLEIWLEGKA